MPLWRGRLKAKNTKKEDKTKPGKKKIIWLVVILSLLLTAGVVRAGSLTPSGSPASTMHTLDEIYQSLAGSFNSGSITASSTGSLVQILQYIVSNLNWSTVGSDVSFTAGRVFESTTTLSSGNLNITSGALQLASTTRIDNLGQATLTTSSISVLTVNTSSSLGNIVFGNATSTGALDINGYSLLSTTTFTNATGTSLNLNGAGAALIVNNSAIFGTTTSTNVFGSSMVFTTGTISVATTTGLYFTNATGTNAFFSGVASSTAFQTGALQFNNATGTNAFFSGVASSTAFQTGALQFNNATGTNIKTSLALFTTASSSNFQSGGLAFGNATGTTLVISGVASSSNFQAGGLAFGNATGTNLFVSGVASSSIFQTPALSFNNATGTNLTVNLVTSNGALTIGNLAQNLTIQGSSTTITATSSSGIIIFNTSSSERLRVTASGSIGIGTTTPLYAFVLGDRTTQKDLVIPKGALCVDDATGAGCTGALTPGQIYASSTSINAVDLAENYPTLDASLTAGDIVSFDTANEENIIKSTPGNANQIMGVISTQPGVLLGRIVENSKAVALSGRVPVKISDEGGAVAVGDPIILSSSTPGVGMKGTNGRIVGYALQNWATGKGLGKIDIFVKLQPAPTEPTFLDQIGLALNSLGVSIQNGIIKATTLIANLIQAKRVETDTVAANGLEMKDVSTGQIYCVQINNGDWLKTPGACGSNNPTAVQTVIAPIPATTDTATVTSTTDATTTVSNNSITTSTPTSTESGVGAPTNSVGATSDATTTP